MALLPSIRRSSRATLAVQEVVEVTMAVCSQQQQDHSRRAAGLECVG